MRRDNVKIALFFVFVSFVLSMSILMSIFFVMNNYIQQKKSKTPLYLFCSPNSTFKDVKNLVDTIKQKKGVLSVRLITRDDAFKEMVKKFSIDKDLFSTNPFPYSIEVFFQPSYTNKEFFDEFAKSIENPIIEDIRYPKTLLKDIESLHQKLLYFSEAVVGLLYATQFIVFVSLMTIFYSHRKFDYDTLKFFGINRLTILRLFMKETITPAFWGFLFSVVIVALLYFVYGKYGQIPYISKEMLQSSQKSTFALNVVIGFMFILVSSVLVFFVNDEKV
ncbi:cell division protein FtsX [Hippea sp. KM1]|uniref:cell division protein FtsX n=1 Tax=Hippea sp. KM1 TaxID=944481 RepID=UPI00046D8193|nr:permease-like cell division protein FtsX [Hippea sp. KM1]